MPQWSLSPPSNGPSPLTAHTHDLINYDNTLNKHTHLEKDKLVYKFLEQSWGEIFSEVRTKDPTMKKHADI